MGFGGVGVSLGKTGQSGVIERTRTKRGVGNGRSKGGAEGAGGCGEPTAGGHAIIRAQRGITCKDHDLSSCASCMRKTIIVLVNSNGIRGALVLDILHVGAVNGTDHMGWVERGTVSEKFVVGQG